MALLPVAPLGAAAGDLRSVAGMQFHNRVLLVFAPALRDPRLTEQRAIMARAALDAANRDLVLVQVADGQVIGAHDLADRLYRRFQLGPRDFRVFLIGKDGTVARRANGPVDAATLMRAIDAMPMRRNEMLRAAAGKGAPQR